MEVAVGQIVTSRQGRDVTKVYMVTAIEGERVLLADGVKRTLAAPKRKNIRHIAPTTTILAAGRADTDLKLKQALADWCASRGAQPKGG
ncbi:MAG: RNA-binding protein [Ruminococcaceae bacterium]|nr:RNA-binding protein [Oscillospiraceae bacterium]